MQKSADNTTLHFKAPWIIPRGCSPRCINKGVHKSTPLAVKKEELARQLAGSTWLTYTAPGFVASSWPGCPPRTRTVSQLARPWDFHGEAHSALTLSTVRNHCLFISTLAVTIACHILCCFSCVQFVYSVCGLWTVRTDSEVLLGKHGRCVSNVSACVY